MVIEHNQFTTSLTNWSHFRCNDKCCVEILTTLQGAESKGPHKHNYHGHPFSCLNGIRGSCLHSFPHLSSVLYQINITACHKFSLQKHILAH